MANIDHIPPPPEKPDPFECCGSGCVPCIFDYYEDKLSEWETTHGYRLAEYEKAKRLDGDANKHD